MIGVITFPGSNGDHDALHSLIDDIGAPAEYVDYRQTDLARYDAFVLPGGFSYGDALRCGAIARFAPVMAPLAEFAERGGPILGICNGFQVLTEAHLLPGALLRNETLKFHCFWTHIKIEQLDNAWTAGCKAGEILRLPVAHGEGAFFADDDTLDQLEANGQIVARYCEPDGTITPGANANGSARSIAAVSNRQGNVLGLMPHPERATNELVGGADGVKIMSSALNFLNVAV
ncbi:MAG: phosphoribosylformylglycinamidine synthase subunit PurQ [Thermomicrobiales bacterium]|nr:phosphoribosylformylglycinamidine synthase subunit PurQ [Thermomicrobiales bacterium]